MGVGDHEGDLGHVGAVAVVTGHRHHLVLDGGDQGEAVAVVDGGETLDLLLRQARVRTEEPAVDGLGRQPGMEGE